MFLNMPLLYNINQVFKGSHNSQNNICCKRKKLSFVCLWRAKWSGLLRSFKISSKIPSVTIPFKSRAWTSSKPPNAHTFCHLHISSNAWFNLLFVFQDVLTLEQNGELWKELCPSAKGAVRLYTVANGYTKHQLPPSHQLFFGKSGEVPPEVQREGSLPTHLPQTTNQ